MLLIVEDNARFSATIKAILSRRALQFDIVDRGREAIERVIAHGDRYALAIIDVGLPDLSGLEIAQMIRAIGDEQRASVPIVIMTGGEAIDTRLISDFHIAAVLYKPFLAGELLSMINQCARWAPAVIGEVSAVAEDQPLADGDLP